MVTNLGLIGAGKWGRNYIKTINKFPDINLVKILSKNHETRQIAPSNSQIFSDLDEFLNTEGIDGAIIASPPETHAEIAIKLINKKIPIIIEKPLTTSYKDALEIFSAAKKNSGIVLVDHIFLYHPIFRYLKKYINQKGKIKFIKSEGGGLGPFRENISGLWDWGPHDISMCLDIVDSMPINIFAEKIKQNNPKSNYGEIVKINLEFENQIHAEILTGNNFPNKKRNFTISKTDEIITFNPLTEHKLVIKNFDNYDDKKFKYIEKNNFQELPLDILIKDFCKYIHEGDTNISDLNLGLNVIKILEDIENIYC